MSKITNDGLTLSGTGWFIAVPIWCVKGLVTHCLETSTNHGLVIMLCDQLHCTVHVSTCSMNPILPLVTVKCISATTA